MALWIVRAGAFGEHEEKFLEENRIYLTWNYLQVHLGNLSNREALMNALQETYPEEKTNTLKNYTAQVWAFSHRMQKGDWVVVPSKLSPTLSFAEITGDYTFHPDGPNPYWHSMEVKWVGKNVPRNVFDQDLLYSFGAFLTVCQVTRNDAEKRVRDIGKNNWKPLIGKRPTAQEKPEAFEEDPSEEPLVNIEQLSYDQIAKIMSRKFAGHGLTNLVAAILRAKGYTTFVSREGADKGVDILAGQDAFGFGNPKLCVQVKSGEIVVDRPTLDQLIGTMQNFKADHGLLVSWGGFKSTVINEIPNQFFKVRLWNQTEIIKEFLSVYEKLEEDIKNEIPLKKMYVLAEIG